MPVVLFAWELGTGLGHVMQIAPAANALVKRGHRVFAALRELGGAAAALDQAVGLLPAPFRSGLPVAPSETRSFADVLRDVTFGDDAMLASHVAAWRTVYDLVKPDLIVFDHAPTALLAARGVAARRAVIGNGFTLPADRDPLPELRRGMADAGAANAGGDAMRAVERPLLERANRLLEEAGERPLERLGELYSDVDAALLTTFAELDPYRDVRPAGTRYLGVANANGGDQPDWPSGGGKRVYAYLRPTPVLGEVFTFLNERAAPTLAFVEGLGTRALARFASATLRVVDRRLDLAAAGRACDVAVMNGNLGTAAAMLLAGRASLHVPLFLEHALNARAVERLGAGLAVDPRRPGGIAAGLGRLLESDRYAAGARVFAERHAGFDAGEQARGIVERLVALLN